jgi:hypothetical protein
MHSSTAHAHVLLTIASPLNCTQGDSVHTSCVSCSAPHPLSTPAPHLALQEAQWPCVALQHGFNHQLCLLPLLLPATTSSCTAGPCCTARLLLRCCCCIVSTVSWAVPNVLQVLLVGFEAGPASFKQRLQLSSRHSRKPPANTLSKAPNKPDTNRHGLTCREKRCTAYTPKI